jgi:hypothetical protein
MKKKKAGYYIDMHGDLAVVTDDSISLLIFDLDDDEWTWATMPYNTLSMFLVEYLGPL